MKIEFLSSRLHSIQSNHNISQKLTTRCPQNLNNSERLGPVVRISFRGNFDKNAKQFINIAAEDKGLGLKEYSKGGLAVVVKEANESWNNTLDADSRVILPYHAPDNAGGNVKVLMKIEYDKNGKQILRANTMDIKPVPVDYRLADGEIFILQSIPDENGVSKYLPIERLDIHGYVKTFENNSLNVINEPYQLFKVIEPNASKNTVTRYLMHTRNLARVAHSYGYSATDNIDMAAYGKNLKSDLLYSIHNKAIADALPKLNTEKHGYFNPANIWLHDRQAFSTLIDIADRNKFGKLCPINCLIASVSLVYVLIISPC